MLLTPSAPSTAAEGGDGYEKRLSQWATQSWMRSRLKPRGWSRPISAKAASSVPWPDTVIVWSTSWPLFAVEVSGTGAALHHHGVHLFELTGEEAEQGYGAAMRAVYWVKTAVP